MESQRSLFAIGLLFVSFLLWQEWQKDYGPQPIQQITETQTISDTPTAVENQDVPASPQNTPSTGTPLSGSESQLIHVTTDTLDMLINTRGGDIVTAKLRKFPVTQTAPDPMTILSNDSSHLYIAQSGLIGRNGPDETVKGRPVYVADSPEYTMSETDESLTVNLLWASDSGINVTKSFIFNRNSHAVEVRYTVNNSSSGYLSLQQYAQLKQTTLEQEGNMFMPTYRGGAYSTADDRYTKYDFGDIADKNLKEATQAGWVAMLQHYFVSAWIPPQEQVNNLYSRSINGAFAIIGYTGQPTTIEAGETAELSSTLYVGPKNQEILANLAENLDLTVDYGFLWWLAQPLFGLLSIIQSFVINWGVTIIVITVLVKGAMYPLTKAQYESMAKLRNLQPKMQALKERYGDDRQKMSQGMMELYKKEKVNPMGGCLPLLLQMPIFLALYWVLLESVELRHAGFFFWITDLSVKDPYFVLPVLAGASMYLLQKLQPMTMQDPMQQKIMQLMPVFMSVIFLWFPAGLVLYMFVSNLITLVQAKIIYAAMDKKGLRAR